MQKKETTKKNVDKQQPGSPNKTCVLMLKEKKNNNSRKMAVRGDTSIIGLFKTSLHCLHFVIMKILHLFIKRVIICQS